MSSGVKDNVGKLRYDLVPYASLDKVVEVITLGEAKYPKPEQNWLLTATPKTIEEYKAAIGRHYSALMQGEEFDPDLGTDHLANIATNCLFIMEMKEKVRQWEQVEQELEDGLI